MTKSNVEDTFNVFLENQKCAIRLIQSMSSLIYEKSVELTLFKNSLREEGVSEMLKLHKKNLTTKEVSVALTAEIAAQLEKMDLRPVTIDIGRLAGAWTEADDGTQTLAEFMQEYLKEALGAGNSKMTPKDVVLFGFGRIGRLVCRELIEQAGRGRQLRLKAIVVRSVDADSIQKRAALINNDSVHGQFAADVTVDQENHLLIINGQVVKFIAASCPEEIDYEKHGIEDALVIDNTGAYTSKEELARHLKAKGAKKVILTAPGKDTKNVVFGVNEGDLDLDNDEIFTAASCTTNAISPVLQVIEREFGIEKGHVETIHAYTNDQNLLDNMHKKYRRGRSAAMNMVITSTGAGKAVSQIIPSLLGKLTSNAVRVPCPNGSLAIMNLKLGKQVTVEEVNRVIRREAEDGKLANQINFSTDPETVSSDIIGNVCCSVFDSSATIVSPDSGSVVLYVWYDNEYGYSMQVVRLAKYVSHVFRQVF